MITTSYKTLKFSKRLCTQSVKNKSQIDQDQIISHQTKTPTKNLEGLLKKKLQRI